MSETITTKVYPTQVRSGDPDAAERGIRPKRDSGDSGDWRDPDLVLELEGFLVQSGDDAYNAHHGANVPDWEQGWRVIDPRGQGRTVFEGRGEPPHWIKAALLEGRQLRGVIVVRDEQRHN